MKTRCSFVCLLSKISPLNKTLFYLSWQCLKSHHKWRSRSHVGGVLMPQLCIAQTAWSSGRNEEMSTITTSFRIGSMVFLWEVKYFSHCNLMAPVHVCTTGLLRKLWLFKTYLTSYTYSAYDYGAGHSKMFYQI